MTAKNKILIVDDHPIFRWGLRELINQEADMTVCAEAETLTEAWKAINATEPDLIIADITLKKSNGLDLVHEIMAGDRYLPVLILSMHDELLYAERAIRAGARGYVMKQEAMESVVTAIRQVLAGKVYLDEKVKENILIHLADGPRSRSQDAAELLSEREMEVFRLIGRGLSTREIAVKLHLSMKTIGTYRERIKEKLRLKHGNELVRCAVQWDKTGRLP